MSLYPPHLSPVGFRKLLQFFTSTHPDQLDSQGHHLAWDWAVHYHLSTVRHNLLKPFHGLLANRFVLEVGAGSGLITRQLAQWARQVVALEPDARLLQLARLRTRDLSNVDWQQTPWTKFAPERLFDVVVVPDGLPEQWEWLLERAYTWLAPHGCLLLATPNPWGLRHQRRYGGPSPNQKLIQMAQNRGFAEAQIYLPFPSHRLPGNLITPQGLTDPRFKVGELVMMQGYLDRRQPPVTGQVAAHKWLKAFEQGIGAEVANSFLLVAYREQPPSPSGDELLAYHYQRWGPEVTRFVRDRSGGLWVQKTLSDAAPMSHPYLQGKLLMAHLALQLGDSRHPEVVLAQFTTTYFNILKQLSGLRHPSVSLDQPVHSSLVDAHPGNIVVDGTGEPHCIDEVNTHEIPSLGVVLLRGLITAASDLPFPSRWPQWVSLEGYLAKVLIRAGLFENRAAFGAYLKHNNLSIPRTRVQLVPADAAMPPLLRSLARVTWKAHDLAVALVAERPGLKRIFWQLVGKN
jgi:2-polyprenyl-3-methyl-5-hydroxy-6-metoxy-1,4-benzoquinol methylase